MGSGFFRSLVDDSWNVRDCCELHCQHAVRASFFWWNLHSTLCISWTFLTHLHCSQEWRTFLFPKLMQQRIALRITVEAQLFLWASDWTLNFWFPAYGAVVLRLQACTTLPSCVLLRNKQGVLRLGRQVLHQLTYTSSLYTDRSTLPSTSHPQGRQAFLQGLPGAWGLVFVDTCWSLPLSSSHHCISSPLLGFTAGPVSQTCAYGTRKIFASRLGFELSTCFSYHNNLATS